MENIERFIISVRQALCLGVPLNEIQERLEGQIDTNAIDHVIAAAQLLIDMDMPSEAKG